MPYVLIARTPGGELLPAADKVIAASFQRAEIEHLRKTRLAEREEWMRQNAALLEAAWWMAEGLIDNERIEEVPAATSFHFRH